MKLSIRNQLTGAVSDIAAAGEAVAAVKVRLSGGQTVTSVITSEAVGDLDLSIGSPVRVLAKSTEVSLATGGVEGLSIRNRLPGKITDITTGGAMADVKVGVDDGEVTAAVTREAVAELDLAPGASVVALIKSTEVSLADA